MHQIGYAYGRFCAISFASIKPGDYFALDAFLPFDGEGRREALEVIRHGVADKLGVVSCLEIGPRYLHSTGQLQKGGTNNGVFLMVSADELKDIPLRHVEPESLGMLARTQAAADLRFLLSAAAAACTCTCPTIPA